MVDALLAREQLAEAAAVVLADAREDNALGGHVDALRHRASGQDTVNQLSQRGRDTHHGEGLGREEHLDEPARKEELDHLRPGSEVSARYACWGSSRDRGDAPP